jgi:pSer/pThr/pTyr-binding forkhead associated (FHA) protein
MSDAFLKIVSGPKQGLNIPLPPQEQLLIGRKRGDLVINDPLISSSHARIYAREDAWYIQDLGSTNGTTVNGQLVRETALRPGAEIGIGNSKLVLFVGLTALKEEEESPTKSSSSRLEIAWLLDEELIEIKGSVDRTHSASDIIDKDLRIPPGLKTVIEVMSGQDAGKVYPCDKGNLTIGRRTGEVPLTDLEVSRRHAVIEMFGREMIFLRDLDSTNGTFHNGRRIDVARLQNSDTIGIGRTVLRVRIGS